MTRCVSMTACKYQARVTHENNQRLGCQVLKQAEIWAGYQRDQKVCKLATGETRGVQASYWGDLFTCVCLCWRQEDSGINYKVDWVLKANYWKDELYVHIYLLYIHTLFMTNGSPSWTVREGDKVRQLFVLSELECFYLCCSVWLTVCVPMWASVCLWGIYAQPHY